MKCRNFYCHSQYENECCTYLTAHDYYNKDEFIKLCVQRKAFNRFETWLRKRAFYKGNPIGMAYEVWEKWQEEKEKVKQ